jgi:glycine/D-amino acid oxidase-like deaminating enzyme
VDVDIAIVGAGPIGAATAHHLRGADVALVARAAPHADDTYRQSGGSICWHRPDPARAAAIAETARFVSDTAGAGAPIRVRDTPYLFLDTGTFVPGLNIHAPDLVDHLLTRAAVRRVDLGTVTAVEAGAGRYRVVGTGGDLTARVVVLACGTGNLALMPALGARVEKRSLMVVDAPVDETRQHLPHIVTRLPGGYVYSFVKEHDGRLRIHVGQEDLVHDDVPGPVDLLPALVRAGLTERLPYLAGARTVEVLWGTDFVDKDPLVVRDGPGVISVTCGSAVRSCLHLGRLAARAATDALAAAT